MLGFTSIGAGPISSAQVTTGSSVYIPLTGTVVNFNFTGSYTPPTGSAVTINFGSVAPTTPVTRRRAILN